MTCFEIAKLLAISPSRVRETIRNLIDIQVIAETPQINNEYVFAGDKGKRDSIVVVAQLSPEFTARLVDRWSELEASKTLPTVRDPRTQALIESLVRLDSLEQAQQQQKLELNQTQETVAALEARINVQTKFFSVLAWANLLGKSYDYAAASELGKRCAQYSRQRGYDITTVSDPRFGRVNAYHKDILTTVMGDIA